MNEPLGCVRCWPDVAEDAWEARRELRELAVLVDESHYRVRVLSCPACGQRYLSVFTETIDWALGEDPQDWALLPLSGAEAAWVVDRGGAVTERELAGLGHGRRSLHFATGGEARFGRGLVVHPHD